jgi:hypothetical protein
MPDEDGIVRPPAFQVGSVFDARHRWHSLVGPLSGEAKAVLSGFMHYPRSSHAVVTARSRNHKSWTDDPEAQAALGPKLGGYLHSGILEFVDPASPAPTIIEPLGVVPKNGVPPFRLITDSRFGNKSLAKWPVRFTTIIMLCLRLDYGDFIILSDVRDAYHCFDKGGCGQGRRRIRVCFVSASGAREWRWATRLGCTPDTCTGTCDKARSGVDLDGMLARFATAHFGETPAGSPLNVLMQELRRYFARRGPFSADRRVDSGSWVDDLVLILKSIFHGFCGGLDAGCAVCAATKLLADELEAHWIGLAPRLGVPLSEDKRQEGAQRGEYTGIIVHTIRGLLLIPDRKLLKVMACLQVVALARGTTARELAAVAGRLLHYSICIRHVRPFVPAIWAVIGCEGEPEYDRPITVSDGLRKLCAYLMETVPVYAPRGAPMWPFVPSSLYAALLRGDAAHAKIRVLHFDGSQGSGWGFGIQTSEDLALRIHPNTWAPDFNSATQVHNEAAAGANALDAAERLVDMTDALIIFRNDCAPALSALRKGSSTSPALQDAAMRIARSCARLNADCLFLHVPGTTLVAEGTDGASRSGAERERGPTCGPELRGRVHALAASHGWDISVDLFACTENTVSPRFFGRFPEPAAEAVDALSVPDWDSSSCPVCGARHREVVFAYPPAELLPHFIRKAVADGIRGVILTPTAVTGPHWVKLLRASLDTAGQGYESIPHPAGLLRHAGPQPPGELALLAVDFRRPGASTHSLAPPCGAEHAFRPRPAAPIGGSDPALAAVRLALRASLHIGGDPAGRVPPFL